MTNEELTATCAEITRSKGFNTSNYPAQLLLMVTELGEALENFWTIDDPTLQHLVAVVTQVSATIEAERHQRCWAAGYSPRMGDGITPSCPRPTDGISMQDGER